MTRSRAPVSLGADGKAFWRKVTSTYELSPAEEVMLARCCRTLDVLGRLDAALMDADDLVVTGSVGQMKPHPALAAAADQQRLLDQLTRALNLPLPAEEQGTGAARRTARTRWRGGGRRRSGPVARWRRRPAPVELPAWVRDPRTDDDLAYAWAEETYAGADPAVRFEVFAALLCIPRYTDGDGYGPVA